jgi:hypothetical protein
MRVGREKINVPPPDDLHEGVRAQFSEAETVNLTMLIATINAWNRLAIASGRFILSSQGRCGLNIGRKP